MRRAAHRAQAFGVALRRELHDGIGGVQDRLGRAIVLLEPQHRGGRREVLGKVEDVAHGGGAKAVDRLGVVADHGEAAPVRLEPQQDLRLKRVGVLIFVDQDEVEAGRRRPRRSAQAPSCAPSTAADRRNRAPAACAWRAHRRGTAVSTRPPTRCTRGTSAGAAAPARSGHSPHTSRSRGKSPSSESAAPCSLKPSSSRTRSIRSAASLRSSTVKAGSRPIGSA